LSTKWCDVSVLRPEKTVHGPRTTLSRALYNHIVTTCYIVIFRISKPNSDPFWRD